MNFRQLRALAGILLVAAALQAVSAKAQPSFQDGRAFVEDHEVRSCIFGETSRELAQAAR
jgi:hypothetical protein